jgi:tRNA(fMet)-specific endonuclease VapC
VDPGLLDTDTLSEFLKQRDPQVIHNASLYLTQFGRFTFSEFTRYEIVRGFLARGANAQLSRFEVFCSHAQILPVTTPIFGRAAELWADARQTGLAPSDGDLLIASTAIEHGLCLITGNHRHFAWINGLRVLDWRT